MNTFNHRPMIVGSKNKDEASEICIVIKTVIFEKQEVLMRDWLRVNKMTLLLAADYHNFIYSIIFKLNYTH